MYICILLSMSNNPSDTIFYIKIIIKIYIYIFQNVKFIYILNIFNNNFLAVFRKHYIITNNQNIKFFFNYLISHILFFIMFMLTFNIINLIRILNFKCVIQTNYIFF